MRKTIQYSDHKIQNRSRRHSGTVSGTRHTRGSDYTIKNFACQLHTHRSHLFLLCDTLYDNPWEKKLN